MMRFKVLIPKGTTRDERHVWYRETASARDLYLSPPEGINNHLYYGFLEKEVTDARTPPSECLFEVQMVFLQMTHAEHLSWEQNMEFGRKLLNKHLEKEAQRIDMEPLYV
ncbi:hypothetical protein [Oceanidesulfovibrio marinus]|uniref:Uncharacterized protein n=1 Tax=Oceanidesulfovibrio marinus TaxID=370038 RepID=A0A6P1ZJ63_9BACT|nr:hypothetical protein [Oceanidesulfovibrio marinus]TVM35623.1 hypothetical protein DQK91_02865 [Oceanidesulfovibrio marinus]